MKNLEYWWDWLQRVKKQAEAPEVDDVMRDEFAADLRKLRGAMESNRPRKGKKQAFKVFIYERLLSEVNSTIWNINPKGRKRFP